MRNDKLTQAHANEVADALISWADTFDDDTKTAGKIRAAARRIKKGTADLTDVQFAQFHLDQKFQDESDYDNDTERAAVAAFFNL